VRSTAEQAHSFHPPTHTKAHTFPLTQRGVLLCCRCYCLQVMDEERVNIDAIAALVHHIDETRDEGMRSQRLELCRLFLVGSVFLKDVSVPGAVCVRHQVQSSSSCLVWQRSPLFTRAYWQATQESARYYRCRCIPPSRIQISYPSFRSRLMVCARW